MNKKKFLILVLLFLSACSQVDNLPPSPMPLVSPTIATVILATPTFFKEEFHPTIKSTSIPANSIVQDCILHQADDQGLTAKGMLLFETFDLKNSHTSFFLYDADSKALSEFPAVGNFMELIGIAPDRNKFLYSYDNEVGDRMIGIADFQGELVKSFSYPNSNGFWAEISWFAPNTLRGVQDMFNGSMRLYNYDVETGNYTELRTDWPDVYQGKKLDWGIDRQAIEANSYIGANMIYSPTQDYLVYPKKKEEISLVHVLTGKELAVIRLPGWGGLPRWSANGENLVLLGGVQSDTSGSVIQAATPDPATLSDEFYIISKNGKSFRKLTDLAAKFKKVSIDEYAWSPDGSKIAFWLATEDNDSLLRGKESKLMILDIKTGGIADLCLEGISRPFNRVEDLIHMIHPQPVWSPNGGQILVTQLDPQDSKKYRVIAVDLASKKAYPIVENLEPIGWMTKEP